MSFIRRYFDRRHRLKTQQVEVISEPSNNEDVRAFIYYGTFGLVDPKAPFVDAPALAAARGMSYWRALAAVSGIRIVTGKQYIE